MKEPKEDFLEQLKNTLLSHEEPYDEGAWERFVSKHKQAEKTVKPVIPIWRWAAAVAAILAGVIFMLQYFNSENKIDSTNKNIPIVNNNKTEGITDQNDLQSIDNVSIVKNGANKKVFTHSEIINEPNNETNPLITSPIIGTTEKEIAAVADPVKANPSATENPQEKKQPGNNFWKNRIVKVDGTDQDQLNRNENSTIIKVSEPVNMASNNHNHSTKWESSLYVSPTYSELGINMGYGYSIGYAVSKKVKISAGIAHTKISASRSYDQPAASTPIITFGSSSKGSLNAGGVDPTLGLVGAANSQTTLSSGGSSLGEVSAAPSLNYLEGYISGIDIPFGINYNISKKLYTEAGISGLFVLKSAHSANYVDNENVKFTVLDNEKIVENKVVSFSSDYSTTSTSSAAQQSNFMGYYNFSMGYKQKISKTNYVALEPFVKVPMKNTNAQKLNYLGMGVRLKFDF